jgi:hypothetical protein
MYKQKYNSVASMNGNKKAGLAHSDSAAMQLGPGKEKKLKVTNELNNDPRVPVANKYGGTTNIKQSTVKAAKGKKGYFKEMPEFKGELVKNNSRITGYKNTVENFSKLQTLLRRKKLWSNTNTIKSFMLKTSPTKPLLQKE